MRLIVGLGNPGLRYKNTRHNVGFLVIEELAREIGLKFKKKQFKGLVGEGWANLEKIILLKPLTYMNLSGLSIASLIKKHSISAQQLLVICDDINLKLGTLRLRDSGSAGGHNGLKSIIQEVGTNNFARLRIGIGKDRKNSFLSDFVLQPFSKLEKKAANQIISIATQACLCWLTFGMAGAMNKFNKHFAID